MFGLLRGALKDTPTFTVYALVLHLVTGNPELLEILAHIALFLGPIRKQQDFF